MRVYIMQRLYALGPKSKSDNSLSKLVEIQGSIHHVILNEADWGFLVFMGFYHPKCLVFNRYGQLKCQIIDELADFRPALAFLPGDRLALAHKDGFALWHLSSGHTLATITPQPGMAGTRGLGNVGLVAANQAGSKLAFCSTAEPVLHVYNSTSLDELYRLEAAADIEVGILSLCSDLLWTVYGWLLVDLNKRELPFGTEPF